MPHLWFLSLQQPKDKHEHHRQHRQKEHVHLAELLHHQSVLLQAHNRVCPKKQQSALKIEQAVSSNKKESEPLKVSSTGRYLS